MKGEYDAVCALSNGDIAVTISGPNHPEAPPFLMCHAMLCICYVPVFILRSLSLRLSKLITSSIKKRLTCNFNHRVKNEDFSTQAQGVHCEKW